MNDRINDTEAGDIVEQSYRIKKLTDDIATEKATHDQKIAQLKDRLKEAHIDLARTCRAVLRNVASPYDIGDE